MSIHTCSYHCQRPACIKAQRDQMREDTWRLDFLEQQGDGTFWVARQSSTGRGYRVHNDRHSGAKTVREAIDYAREITSKQNE